MKIAVYTVIIGLFDMPKNVRPEYHQEADFFLISDSMGTNNGYKTISVKREEEDPRLESRKYKMKPHEFLPGYDYYLYLDGSIELKASPVWLIGKYLKEQNIALFDHPYRHSLFEEFYYCYYWKKELRSSLEIMMEWLLKEQVPEDSPLTENGVILRRDNQQTRSLGEFWWKIFKKFPTRDQLSLPYCLWKMKVPYSLFDGLSISSSEFKLNPHI